jgi:hypothetical protein
MLFGANMRTHLAIVTFVGGILALYPAADAAPKSKRSAKPPYQYYAAQPRYQTRERLLCEERARNEDPAGQFAGYPCWAREIFGRGSNTGGRGN